MDWKEIWRPEEILNCDDREKRANYALIILNRPIIAERHLVECLWNHASIKILVDGGSTRWLRWLKEHNLSDKMKPPNLITGDLDSCHPDSLEFFSSLGVEICQTMDQNETDFTKSLKVLETFTKDLKIKNIIVLCENSGRMDHIAANINSLFKCHQRSSVPVFILTSNSISWLLQPGHHQIHIPSTLKHLWCALIPIGRPSKVTTKGLKWNLNNQILQFGDIVSTSNKYDQLCDGIVDVRTDNPILWSMGTSKIDDE